MLPIKIVGGGIEVVIRTEPKGQNPRFGVSLALLPPPWE